MVMSKLDDIRRMREAKYDRQHAKPHVGELGSRTDRRTDKVRTKGPKPETVEKPVSLRVPNPAETKGFDRTAYQRDYMKNKYRPRLKAKQEAEAAELARLRELLKQSAD